MGCPQLLIVSPDNTQLAEVKLTFDLDDGSPDVLDLSRTELDDVLGGVESFPGHGTGHGRGELVGRGEARRAALQTLVRRLRTERVG